VSRVSFWIKLKFAAMALCTSLPAIISGQKKFGSEDLVAQGPTSWPNRSVAIHFHLHHQDYIAKLMSGLRRLEGLSFELWLTTSSHQTLKELECLLFAEGLGSNSHLVLVENRGRDIRPFFVELKNELSNFDIVIHAHSKHSKHMNRARAEKWIEILWSSIFSSSRHLAKVLDAFNRHPEVGLYYADSRSIVRDQNWSWGASYKWSQKHPSPRPPRSAVFSFPAGSFFAVRGNLYGLIADEVSDEFFESEAGQLDGTYAHFLERYIGWKAHEIGMAHLLGAIEGDLLLCSRGQIGGRSRF
jgi:lipopolysaccharide biosynthesis protein